MCKPIMNRTDRKIIARGNKEIFSLQSLRKASPAVTVNSIEIIDMSDKPIPFSIEANGNTSRTLINMLGINIRNNTNVCK